MKNHKKTLQRLDNGTIVEITHGNQRVLAEGEELREFKRKLSEMAAPPNPYARPGSGVDIKDFIQRSKEAEELAKNTTVWVDWDLQIEFITMPPSKKLQHEASHKLHQLLEDIISRYSDEVSVYDLYINEEINITY